MIKVAIALLNWNTQSILQEFLPSVVKHTPAKDHQIFLIDNGSEDDSVEFVSKHFPSVRIISLDKNYGFTGGYNRALVDIDAEYYVLLNSDVEVSSNWTTPIIERMDNNRNIAACQPKILAYSNKSMFEYAGAAGGFIDYLGFPFCKGRIFNHIETDNGQFEEASPIFWASGAAMFVRAKLFVEMNGFDEDFFAHMEEIDLCWRFKNAGYSIYYEPKSVVYHLGGGTLPNESPGKIYLNFRNNLSLLYKNLPSKVLHRIMFFRMILDGIAALQFAAKFKFQFFASILRAHRDYHKNKSHLKRKRKRMAPQEIADYPSEVYTKSIVFSFYAKGLNRFEDVKKFISSK